jgi:SAM-dependent methyltransferase
LSRLGEEMADPFADFKAKQREAWKHFAPLEVVTTMPAARLVRFAGVRDGQEVLDVCCGTGVAAISAARAGAKATGLDMTPELLAKAKENAAIAGLREIVWKEGDVEALPFDDAHFDVVVSQFGHMFGPRPEVAANEMLRVLRPGGTIAFATWPPESVSGRLFLINSKYVPPPPGVPPNVAWGDPAVVERRLGSAVRDLHFERGLMQFPALSPQHYQHTTETMGPGVRLVEALQKEPAKLTAFRREVVSTVTPYFRDNAVQMEYLLTRAEKR